jgi:protein-S-isoprenylcysteine O-methyltransferase Ste14
LALAVLGLALARPSLAMSVVGTGLVALGLVVRVWASGFLDKGGPLCMDGPYRYVRHPLYLGSLIGALGFCAMMNVVWGWAVVLPLFLVLYGYQVAAEERWLRQAYGEAHAQYASRVPLLTPAPGRRAAGGGRSWEMSRVLLNREHYHVLISLALAGLFFVKLYWG